MVLKTKMDRLESTVGRGDGGVFLHPQVVGLSPLRPPQESRPGGWGGVRSGLRARGGYLGTLEPQLGGASHPKGPSQPGARVVCVCVCV